MAAIPFLLTVMPSNVALGGTQFTVNNTHDEVDATAGDGLCQSASGSCTLRAAIMEANALPGADTIVLPVGLYRMEVPAGQVDEDSDSSGDFDITDDVSIRGSDKDSTKILGCGGTYGLLCGLYRAFEVAPGVSANVSGLMVISASTRDVGGAFENYGTLTLSEVLIESTNGAFGAGVYNHVGASLRMTNSRLVNGGSLIGLSNLRGAGLYNEGVADLVGDVFERNQATEHGGGIYNSGTITVRDSTLIGNSARFTGGGLGNFGTAGVSETNFVGNVTANVGGGISNSGTMIVSGSSIRSNIAAHSNVALTGLEGGGGGIGQLGGSLELSSTTVSGNLAYAGGGLSVLYPLGHPIRGSTFSGNTAATDGRDLHRL